MRNDNFRGGGRDFNRNRQFSGPRRDNRRRDDGTNLLEGKEDKILEVTSEGYSEFSEEAKKFVIAIDRTKNKVNTNQLRNFYDLIINSKDSAYPEKKKNLFRLKILLEYSLGRELIDSSFNKTIQALIKTLEEENDEQKFMVKFENFCDFMEAFVAYNKAYGKKG